MIAFAQGFPMGRPGEPDGPRRSKIAQVGRRPRLDAGQWLALAGSALLAVGVFMPFLWHRSLGESLSLWRQEMHAAMPLASAALLALAIISAVLAVKRSYVFLWLTGFAGYMALACAVLLSAHLGSLAPPVAPSPDFPVNGPSELFTFAIGWYVLTLGNLLLFAGALVDGILDQRRPTLLPALPAKRFEWRGGDPTWINRIALHGPIGEG
jgi:hypothetical protein